MAIDTIEPCIWKEATRGEFIEILCALSGQPEYSGLRLQLEIRLAASSGDFRPTNCKF